MTSKAAKQTKTDNAQQISNNSFPGHSLGESRNEGAFAVVKADGSVVTWGSKIDGGNSSAVADQLDGTIDVSHIYSAYQAFAALRSRVGWASVFLLAHRLRQIPRGQTIKLFAHPTLAIALPLNIFRD